MISFNKKYKSFEDFCPCNFRNISVSSRKENSVSCNVCNYICKLYDGEISWIEVKDDKNIIFIHNGYVTIRKSESFTAKTVRNIFNKELIDLSSIKNKIEKIMVLM